jgi:hypothetical protein
MPAKPKLENKIYVAFILSDGDNLQYIEHVMLMLWNRDARGTVPMGWTVSPAMIDAMPGALNYYHQSSTDNDNLLVGPSGYGYTYPDYWTSPPTRLGSSKTNAAALAEFAAKTEEYNVKAGLRAITVWNTIENGISANATKNAYADNMPTLLGITTQNTGGTLSIYNSKLPSKPLTCNYCTNVAAMKEHINSAANGWNERIPLFLIIQAENWANSPATFKEVADSYKDNDNYKIVRPDHIFQLIREYNGLTINPGGVDGDGDGLTGVYFDGDDFKTRVITRKDTCVDFNWVDENGNYISPAEGVANNNYSVRWTGKITPRYTGGCTFYVTSDRGCRLWVNDELLFDKWSRNSSGTESGTISLTAGEKYDIKLEYHRARSGANCKLEWASPMHSREVVPLSFLYEDPNPGTDPTGLDDMYAASGFRIYPDPSAREILNIETGLSGNGNTDLTVYDISGKVLWQQTVYGTRLQLNTSRFSKGVCLISVRTEKYSKTVRYIVR